MKNCLNLLTFTAIQTTTTKMIAKSEKFNEIYIFPIQNLKVKEGFQVHYWTFATENNFHYFV